jgi:hypothetical protein
MRMLNVPENFRSAKGSGICSAFSHRYYEVDAAAG